MARDATTAHSHTGLYARLLAREERAAANGGTLSNPETGTGYQGRPERLAALRAGRPVDLPASALPSEARPGVECRWWTRAVVQPDGAIAFNDDDASQFLAENGL
jgi:hypothetical protein